MALKTPTFDVGVSLYKSLDLTKKTRKHPDALIRHCARYILRFTGGLSLRKIQDIEEQVTGKRPHHSSIINSLKESYIDQDYYYLVLGKYARLIEEMPIAKEGLDQ